MIKLNDVVTLHYSVMTTDGTSIDSSRDGDPMQVMVGSRFLIDGLENALIGRDKGEIFELTLDPEQAYGKRHEQLVQDVPKSMFDGVDIELGMTFRATTDEGEQSVMVVDISDDSVTVDGNHPLAGIPLMFDVEILDFRAPTDNELADNQLSCCATGSCKH